MMKMLKNNILTLFHDGKTIRLDCYMELVVELINAFGFMTWQMAYSLIGSQKIEELISANICKEIDGNICPILIPCKNVFYSGKINIMSLADNKKIIMQEKIYEIMTNGGDCFYDGIKKETINGMVLEHGVECLYDRDLPKVLVKNDKRGNRFFGCKNEKDEYYCPDIVVPCENGECYACMVEIYPKKIGKYVEIFKLISANKIYKAITIFCYGECIGNIQAAYKEYIKNDNIVLTIREL